MDPLKKQTEFEDHVFRELAVTSDFLAGKTFYDCVFSDCNFHETTFVDCAFHDVTFERCDLSLVKLTRCYFANTCFQGSKLIGVDWTAVSWSALGGNNAIKFHDCNISYSTFVGLKLRQIVIIDCLAKEVDFTQAILQNGDFSGTDLSQSQFSQTDLTQADFRNAKNYHIDMTANKVKGARFSMPEAMALLASFEIVIE